MGGKPTLLLSLLVLLLGVFFLLFYPTLFQGNVDPLKNAQILYQQLKMVKASGDTTKIMNTLSSLLLEPLSDEEKSKILQELITLWDGEQPLLIRKNVKEVGAEIADICIRGVYPNPSQTSRDIIVWRVARFVYRMGDFPNSGRIYNFLLSIVPENYPYLMDASLNYVISTTFADNLEPYIPFYQTVLKSTYKSLHFEKKQYFDSADAKIDIPGTKTIVFDPPEAFRNKEYGKVAADLWKWGLKAPEKGYFFPERSLTIHTVDNMKFEATGLYYNDRGEFIFDKGDIKSALDIHKSSTLSRMETINGNLFMTTTLINNYYHFLIETLSVLSVLEDNKYFTTHPDAKVYIQEQEGQPFPFEFILHTIFNFPRDRVIFKTIEKPLVTFQVEQITLPFWPIMDSFTFTYSHATIPSKFALVSLHDRLTKNVRPKMKEEIMKKRGYIIYLTRNQLPLRGSPHDGRFIELMSKKYEDKFKVVDSHEHNAFQQKELFLRAKLVIGPHGGALSNVIYCLPGTGVIEFPVEQEFFSIYFHNIAAALDLNYWLYPEIYSSYYGQFYFDDDAVDRLLIAVDEVLRVL